MILTKMGNSKKTTKLTRGYKNCNPGNIEKSKDVFQGEVRPSRDKRFKQFESMAYGYRAMFVTLDTYRKRGRDTIQKIITAWAPSVENHTEHYINCVEKWSGVDRNLSLTDQDGEEYIKIVAAMSKMENGTAPDMADVLTGFRLQSRIKT